MAKELTPTELAYANLVKAVRSQVRLKHSIKADRELNARIPQIEKAFMAAVKVGQAKEFILSAVSEVVNEVA